MNLKFRTHLPVGLLAVAVAFAVSCASTGTGEVRMPTGFPVVSGLEGHPLDWEQVSSAKGVVFIFVRTDCPISNRYAPEVQRLASRFETRGLRFFLVYPDSDETSAVIQKHLQEYNYKLTALRDPEHALVKKAAARVTPEAAVFSSKGELLYHGRIDNRYVDFGRDRPEATERDLEKVLQAIADGNTARFISHPAVGCYISPR